MEGMDRCVDEVAAQVNVHLGPSWGQAGVGKLSQRLLQRGSLVFTPDSCFVCHANLSALESLFMALLPTVSDIKDAYSCSLGTIKQCKRLKAFAFI